MLPLAAPAVVRRVPALLPMPVMSSVPRLAFGKRVRLVCPLAALMPQRQRQALRQRAAVVLAALLAR